ncbi:lysophospholipid acyltransferase family protein [Novipirellula artificiosorum]|uniref:Acyltransferase n=1 Tax=Novipirellula artificiosorum TaxID=2528016 RepID=A0A5C6E1A9_9BACT|nr:lysophospholipid acyltransferase family protein [Novipirellula artificiosorum]TWU42505.1 Acyltransferase [Novipirellula artificiosorum]
MNRYRMRFAPSVWKPKLNPWLVDWLRPLRKRRQWSELRINRVSVVGESIVRDQLDAGSGVLLMPNHSSHADPYIIYAAADRIGTALYVMATWHVFDGQPWLTQQLLRCHGCFSVDREANDIGAFRLATGILQEKKQPLVLFPEGEIYHCNDRVTPFREGAAAIAVSAARKSKRPIVCVPCAMTYRYEDDPTDQLVETMGELEEAILWRRRTGRPLSQRVYQFAEALLAVKELEYFDHASRGPLPERIRVLGDHILSQVESRHGILAGSSSVPERVKAVRRTIIEQLESDDCSSELAAKLNDDLEDMFLVVQSFSYPGDYVKAEPSIERLAETLDKFEEDILRRSTASIKAERSVRVQFGDAIAVTGDRKDKGQTSRITSKVEAAVQSMLDEGARWRCGSA